MTGYHYEKTITPQALRSAISAGRVMLRATIWVYDDGVMVTVPVGDHATGETFTSALTATGRPGEPRVFATMWAAKDALMRVGLTRYSVMRDGEECWA